MVGNLGEKYLLALAAHKTVDPLAKWLLISPR
jgi:hypothetical protein